MHVPPTQTTAHTYTHMYICMSILILVYTTCITIKLNSQRQTIIWGNIYNVHHQLSIRHGDISYVMHDLGGNGHVIQHYTNNAT